MKKIAKTLLLGAYVFAIIYLFGCFSQASFNIVKWDSAFRIFVGIMGGSASLFAMFSYLIYLDDLY